MAICYYQIECDYSKKKQKSVRSVCNIFNLQWVMFVGKCLLQSVEIQLELRTTPNYTLSDLLSVLVSALVQLYCKYKDWNAGKWGSGTKWHKVEFWVLNRMKWQVLVHAA